MASYLLRIEDGDYTNWEIREADSAKQAVLDSAIHPKDEVDLWTLRSSEPRRFRIKTESVTTIERVE